MLGMCKTKPTIGGIELLNGLEASDPKPGQVRIRVSGCGICGTDLHIYKWTPWAAQRMTLPTIMGHEVGGIVEAVGVGVTSCHPGDRVSLESHIFCGECYQCRTSRAHLCANMKYLGIDVGGGFAEYVTVPASIVWSHPAPVEGDVAAMFEPFGIAVHASLVGCGIAGANVLITGCGPIGLMNLMVARAFGAAHIIGSDINPRRLALAARLGSDRIVAVPDEDVVAIARDITHGRGVDVAIDYSGDQSAINQAAEAVCAGGELRLLGAGSDRITINPTQWVLKELKIVTVHGRRIFETWEQAGRLIYSGRVNLKPLISHSVPLKNGLRGFDLIQSGEAVQVIISPDA